MELFIWKCPDCRIRVRTILDLHINQRPICVECNVEMQRDTDWNVCPDCASKLEYPGDGGVKCSKCPYWFCY